jgi:hypothetical protein
MAGEKFIHFKDLKIKEIITNLIFNRNYFIQNFKKIDLNVAKENYIHKIQFSWN